MSFIFDKFRQQLRGPKSPVGKQRLFHHRMSCQAHVSLFRAICASNLCPVLKVDQAGSHTTEPICCQKTLLLTKEGNKNLFCQLKPEIKSQQYLNVTKMAMLPASLDMTFNGFWDRLFMTKPALAVCVPQLQSISVN